jgi:hypothetical protein
MAGTKGPKAKGGDKMTKVLYDGEVIGEVITNRSMTVWEVLEIIGINPEDMEAGERKYDPELFDIVWDDED